MRLHRGSYLALVVALSACTTIAPFSHTAFEQATSVKAHAVFVMDSATEPYAEHKAEVRELRLAVEKAYEYAKSRPRNEESRQQWEIVRDPNRDSLAGFLGYWEQKGALKPAYIADQKNEIAKHFDEIIKLELGKVGSKDGGTKHADSP
jgi:hypothetical protein